MFYDIFVAVVAIATMNIRITLRAVHPSFFSNTTLKSFILS